MRNHPKERIQHLEKGESLKSRSVTLNEITLQFQVNVIFATTKASRYPPDRTRRGARRTTEFLPLTGIER